MELVELTVEKMTYGGAGLGRHEGMVLFIPFALPGERVRVRVNRRSKRWAEAELVEIVESGPDRIEPRCPHFGREKCGGCHWQHAAYEAQLRYKTEIVQEQLQRIGKIEAPPVRPCIGMPEPWYYRNNVQLHSAAEGVGFVSEDNRSVYPIDRCFIMNGAIYPLFQIVEGDPHPGVKRLVLRGSERTGERLVVIEGKNSSIEPAFPGDVHVVRRGRDGRLQCLVGEGAYHETAGGRTWHISANSFFQVNTTQAEQLLALVREFAAPLEGNEILLDAYAGAGLFALSFAGEVRHVYLVESHPAALEDARRNAAEQGNVTIIGAKSERVLPGWSQYGEPPDLVLLDPPRAGCKEVVLQALGEMAVPTIIYVSCDPATQARDIRRLLDLGYKLDVVQPVDLFPQTYHIESVARLDFQP